MRQPVKKSGPFQKPRSKTVSKPAAAETQKKNEKKQGAKEKDRRLPPKHGTKRRWTRPHKQEYGTSKLEKRFAENFLDKLGIEYVYQFKMVSIGRYLDFYIPSCNVAIEVDGDFYHSYGLVYEQMNPMQKKNKRVDEQKNHWCAVNCIKLIRIWEHDINEHPEKVMEMLREELHSAAIEEKRKAEMRKRH
jgi:very-short-patch-repair endonuclease